MNGKHAEEVKAIAAVTADYVEVFEPPLADQPHIGVLKAVIDMVNIQPGGLNFVDNIDLNAVMRDLFSLIWT